MDAGRIEATLAECERALGMPGRVDLGACGFWRAVSATKRDQTLAYRYAERIGAVDQEAFRRAVRPTFPLAPGTAILSAGAAAGVVLVALAFVPPDATLRGLAILAGYGAIVGTTHGLAHLVAGRRLGIRFTRWYLDGPFRLQPGLKIDYASYLRAPARSRAWMHAWGAIVSKIVPFALLPFAVAAAAPIWTALALVAIGAVQLVTDVTFSVRASDWKKFRREMRLAR